jgi:hypothetical protein
MSCGSPRCFLDRGNLRRSEQDTVLGRLGFERLAVLRTAP